MLRQKPDCFLPRNLPTVAVRHNLNLFILQPVEAPNAESDDHADNGNHIIDEPQPGHRRAALMYCELFQLVKILGLDWSPIEKFEQKQAQRAGNGACQFGHKCLYGKGYSFRFNTGLKLTVCVVGSSQKSVFVK